MSNSEVPFGIKIENAVNSNGDDLPFGYYEPTSDGKVTWNCGYDKDGKITSVFCYRNEEHTERKIAYLPSLNDALFARSQLIEAGWNKIKAPEITFSYEGENKEMTRKEKRDFNKNLKTLIKNNPYQQ